MDTNQLQLENEKLNARLEKAKEVFKQQAADIKAKDEAFIKLRDEYNEHQVELNNTKKDLHIANEKLSEFESKCTRYDEVIKSLNEKNDDLDTLATSRLADIKKRDEDIVNLNNIIEEINGTYNQLNDEHNSLLAQVKDLNDEVNSLQDNIVSKDTAYKELQDTYNNLVAEQLRYTGELNSKIETLEAELSEKNKALDKALNEIQSLTNRLNTETGKIEEVKTKAEVAVTSIKKKLQALNDGLGEEFNIFG